jgi:hypothetical protein
MKTSTISSSMLLLSLCVFIFSPCFISGQVIPQYEWAHCFGGSKEEYGMDLKQGNDGGYVMTGWSYSNDGDVSGNHGNNDLWVVKTDAGGNLQWQQAFGGTQYEAGYSIQPTPDGGYIVAGSSSSNDGNVSGHHGQTGLFNDDVWVAKISATGSLLWQKSFGGTQQDFASCIQNTADGGFILTGEAFSTDGDLTDNKGNGDLWIIKLDANGNIQWQKNYGGNKYESGNNIIQTLDGGYIAAGYSFSNNKDVSGHHGSTSIPDGWLLRIDANGNMLWQRSLGGTGADICYSITENADGSFVTSGFAYSDDGDVHGHHGNGDWWVVWLDANGSIQKDKCYGGTSQESCYSIRNIGEGTYLLGGYNQSADGDAAYAYGGVDYWMMVIDTTGSIVWESSYGGHGNDSGEMAILNADGDAVIAGYEDSNNGQVFLNHGSHDFWLVKRGTPANSILTFVADTAFCPGSKVNVSFSVTGTYNAGNIFTAQLSPFSNPVNIGSVAGTSGGVIQCTIPTVYPALNYFIRVVSSDPVVYGVDNGNYLDIACPPPQNLSVTSVSSTSASLDWNITTDCSIKYILRYRKTDSGGWTTVNNINSSSYTLNNLSSATKYSWSVIAKCKSPGAKSGFVYGDDFTTSPLKATTDALLETQLSVFPNPFSDQAIIQYYISERANISIDLFDLSGRKINTIVAGKREAGNYQQVVENDNLLPGTYFLKLYEWNDGEKTIPQMRTQIVTIQ